MNGLKTTKNIENLHLYTFKDVRCYFRTYP